MAKKEKNAEVIVMPSVLAFEKKLVPSDGFMFSTKWDDRSIITPLALREKSVRGTISNRFKSKDLKNPEKIEANIESANLQRVDNCSVNHDDDTLVIDLTIKVIAGVEKPYACNSPAFAEAYTKAVSEYIESSKLEELSYRYAYNIASARFLWRNRVGAEKLQVVVTYNDKEIKFDDSKKYSTRSFNRYPEIEELANLIADALCGKVSSRLFKVKAYALVGKAQEVYPSEELVLDKNTSGNGNKSKILYSVDGIAAMHSQKIGNALRTIDTWYPAGDADRKPIAIETYGSVTTLGKAYRTPKNNDFFTLFDDFAVGKDIADDQKDYVLAMLIRGGVFGASDKE